ncbi:hypothetical protein [Cellulomonas sp. ATA003]|uniref:hypothetical protein n=1 Tax=Cellulomonas sp. ATA003 TaxID=3073064 RepID=UPI0028737CB2|nr:hypothetical protein [Cellulomonas sp. ATA003]WNB86262.1 hypothetical protein REH70_03075 [Cellulomonas sp. ATA003]
MTHPTSQRTDRRVRSWPLTMAPVSAQLAPEVDPRWAEDFILELRMLDVPGRAIGDALVEVGSHCAESGETAQDAFGDPVAYARSLDLPNVPFTRADLGPILPWVLQPIGLLLAVGSASTLRTGEPVEITTGLLAVATVLVVAVVALLRWFTPFVRFVVRRPVVTWAVLMAHFALLVVLFLVLRGVVATVPGSLALGTGVLLLAVGTVWELVHLRSEAGDDDPVTATVDAPGARADERRRTRWGMTALRYGGALIAPIAAVVLVAVDVLLLG